MKFLLCILLVVPLLAHGTGAVHGVTNEVACAACVAAAHHGDEAAPETPDLSANGNGGGNAGGNGGGNAGGNGGGNPGGNGGGNAGGESSNGGSAGGNGGGNAGGNGGSAGGGNGANAGGNGGGSNDGNAGHGGASGTPGNGNGQGATTGGNGHGNGRGASGSSTDPGHGATKPVEQHDPAETMQGHPVAIFDYAFISRHDLVLDAGRSFDDERLDNFTWHVSGFPPLWGMTATIELPGDGEYLVTLEVADADGLTDSATLAFRIAPPYRHFNLDPIPIIDATTNGTHALLDAAASTDGDDDPLTYAWYVDGMAAGQGPRLAHYFPLNGEFEVALVASDPYGGSGVGIQHVELDGAEAPHVTVDLWSGAFLDEPVFLDASRTWSREMGPLEFHWVVEGQSLTSTAPLLIFQPARDGDLAVHLTVTSPSGKQADHTEHLHIVDWWSLFAGEAGQDMRTTVTVSAAAAMTAMGTESSLATAELNGAPLVAFSSLALMALGLERRRTTRR